MHQQRKQVLLVDGDVMRAERLAKRLSHLDFDVQILPNGAEALLTAHEARPDVVVAAADTPVLNGYLMLEAMRSEPRTSSVPVILITPGSGHEELARGWKAGADLCVPRNQGEADVLATLNRALLSFVSSAASRGLTLVSS